MLSIASNIVQDQLTLALLLGFLGFALSTLITPVYTNVAFKHKLWKKIRQNSTTGEKAIVLNRLHKEKHLRNIPTMAGVIFVVATALITISFNFSREQTLLPLVATLGAGMVGLIDDVINVRGIGIGVAGLSSRLKFGLITLVATLGGLYFYYKLGYDSFHLTFIGEVNIGILLVPLFVLVVISSANAVNISDGLDGLAGGLLSTAFLMYAMIAFLQGNYGIAGFCMTVVGALLSYLWFNIYPARFMMGDVGSFALGTALGVVAMLTGTLVLLPVIGFVFVIEAGSSFLQILSKRIRGKKIFKIAPIHHHFEAEGWPETKVTMRFWIIAQMSGVIGLVFAVLGGHI